jgi:hypothetical protein
MESCFDLSSSNSKVVKDNTEHANTEKKIRLKPEFTEWLRTDEFEQLRGGFVPASDNEDEDEEEQG